MTDCRTEIEKKIGVAPLETISIDPTKPLYEACRRMLESRARRIPLIDIDPDSGHHHIASVLTQYRILKFVAVNVKETQMLRKPLADLNVGTYKDLVFSTLDQPVIDVIHKLVKHNISNIPILDVDGKISLHLCGRVR
jgi:5'-AMP-activated protein kinase regulatory gamma subunit